MPGFNGLAMGHRGRRVHAAARSRLGRHLVCAVPLDALMCAREAYLSGGLMDVRLRSENAETVMAQAGTRG